MLYPFFNSIEPPRTRLSEELEFVLRVAFGSSGDLHAAAALCLKALPSGGAPLRWARELGIEGTFAERVLQLGTASAGSPESIAELEIVRRDSLARQTKMEALRNGLQHVVTNVGVDLVLFDGCAGVRPNKNSQATTGSEVFALARREDVPKLVTALGHVGFSEWTPGPLRFDHELPFVRMVPGGPFVDLACLKRSGVLVPVKTSGGYGLWQPSQAVRAAYVTAQALIEHRFDVERSFMGVLHLASTFGLGNDEALAFDTYLLLQTDIEHEEYQAWRELMRALEAGQLRGLSPRARALLDHALARARSPLYRVKLLAQHKAQEWQKEGGTERLADALEKLVHVVRRRR